MDKDMEEILKIVDEIIFNLAIFLKSIAEDSDIESICAHVRYMIFNNYLSNNPLLGLENYPKYIETFEVKYLDLSTSRILVPYGCIECRHIANFLSKVYTELGYDNSQIFVYRPDLDIVIYSENPEEIDYNLVQQCFDKAFEVIDINSTMKDDTMHTEIGGEIIDIIYHHASEFVVLFGNHTINAVLDSNGYVHFVDSINGKVVNRANDYFSLEILSNNGLKEKLFPSGLVRLEKELVAAGMVRGLDLLYDYEDTDFQKRAKRMEQYLKSCQSREKEFLKFKENNSKYYDMVSKRIRKLVK